MMNSDSVAIVLGAARSSDGNNVPPSLLSIYDNDIVLDWTLAALSAIRCEQVHFVGGYRLSEIAQKRPSLNYLYNPDWTNSGVLHSLYFARHQFGKKVIVSYSDIVYRPRALQAIMNCVDDDVVIAAVQIQSGNQCRKNRVCVQANGVVKRIGFFDEKSGEINAEFCGFALFQNQGAELLKQFFDEHYPQICDKPFEQSEKAQKAYLTDFIRHVIKFGLRVRAVDVTGDWAEINHVHALAKFVLGTKSETLQRISPLLKQSYVPDLFYFSTQAWSHNPEVVLAKISASFKDCSIVVRSSARHEDAWDDSSAGRYQSVLGVNPADPTETRRAILSVIASYQAESGEYTDQVLIQKMVANVSVSGVVFTRTLDHHAPYYVANFETNGRTDGVTSGATVNSELVLVRKDCQEKEIPELLRPIVQAVSEVERLLNHGQLDIEFASSGAEVALLQVRPITTEATVEDIEHKHPALVSGIKRQIRALQKTKFNLLGQTTYLSNMTDWNPAEMLGEQVYPLSSSLYDYLITASTWREARAFLGYKEVPPLPLMVLLGNKPYIDVRVSLNSFLPQRMGVEFGEKLVNHWLYKLAENPELHDKIEFEVAQTCWFFDFREWVGRCWGELFSPAEREVIHQTYLAHTLDIFKQYFEQKAKLEARMEAVFNKRVYWQQWQREPSITLVKALLEIAKEGAFVFSVYARWGFIASTLLKSLCRVGILSEARAEQWVGSIQTVASDFVRMQNEVFEGERDLADFMQQFGHLRPGAYNICAERYETQTRYLRPEKRSTVSGGSDECFVLTRQEREKLTSILADTLQITSEEFLAFVNDATQKREYGKLIFTAPLSDALEVIADVVQHYDLPRESVRYLSINQLFDLPIKNTSDIAQFLEQLIERETLNWSLQQSVVLPDLIFSEVDADVVTFPVAKPNFVTVLSCVAPIVEYSPGINRADLEDHFVAIPSADPGFDWLFSFNIKGIITMYGGAASHMTIRAAEFGIPAAIGCGKKLYQELVVSDLVMIDCAAKQIGPA